MVRLPGQGESGPTLEIFQYDRMTDRSDKGPNVSGLAHLAFGVDDVDLTVRAVLAVAR